MQKPTEAQKETITLLNAIYRALALTGIYRPESLRWVQDELMNDLHTKDESRIRAEFSAHIGRELDSRED